MSTAKWTFLVYMAGDNNLASAGDEDLREMRTVGSTDEVNVVVQFDNAGTRGTERYRVLAGGDDVVESLGETDSGDPNVLLDFIRWAHNTYPADRYALVLWNHGGGWAPSAIDQVAQEIRAPGFGTREAVERAASPLQRTFFRPSLETILSLASPQERAICSDDGSGHSLDTVELGKVLQKAADVLGQPIDLLGMDACLMSNLEVAYEARPWVRYMVASEETEPNEGWPYERVLPRLVAEPGLPTAELARHIVSSYTRSYAEREYAGDITQAAFDLSRLDSLTTALDQLSAALAERLPAVRGQVWDAHRGTKRFAQNTLADVGNFGQQVKRTVPEVAEAADAVLAALQPGTDAFVVAEEHAGDGVAACTGVTVYLPNALVGISQFYPDLEFAKQRQWLRMVEAYVQ